MTNESRDEAQVRAMLQRRAADAHPSPGAWEAITSRLGEPEPATVLPFRRSEGRRRALVGAAAAALVVVVGVGAYALAASDGEPAGVVAGVPEQDQPDTTSPDVQSTEGTPIQAVWPVATEEALRAFADANPYATDPLGVASGYLAERLVDGGGAPVRFDDLSDGIDGAPSLQIPYTTESAAGQVFLRRLGGEGGPWYVVAAASDVLVFEVASDDAGQPFYEMTTAASGELAYEIDETGVPLERARSAVVAGPVVLGSTDRSAPAIVRARLFDETGALAAFIEVRTDPGATDPGGAPDDEVAAPETTFPATTVPPRTTTSTTSPVEGGAAVGETTVVLESDGLGFLGAGDDTTISRLGFGIDQDGVLAALTATLGEPRELGTNEDCPPGPAEVAQFADGFVATFQDGAFVGWAVQEPSVITTATGIGYGSTLADVQAAYAGITVEETSLGWELTGGDLYGIVSGPDPDATVENLFGGANCIFR